MKKIMLACALTILSLPTLADSFWNHNGSVMRLQANGNHRVISYEKPSAKMKKTGVKKGTILFEGQRIGNQYKGTAHVFSKDCGGAGGGLGYGVSGKVVNEKKIVVTGTREKYASNCTPTGKYVKDTLSFNYLYSK